VGAAPLLGINGLVLKGHGRSDAYALFNAIRTARQAVEADLLVALRSAIQEQLQQIQPPSQAGKAEPVYE
jgi:glycerol-3-phosphate acyltransferase PlsX